MSPKMFAIMAAVAATSLASSAFAGRIIVDISSTSSPGTRGPATTLDGLSTVYYNEIAAGSATPAYAYRNTIANLVDVDNNATGIALNVLGLDALPTTGSKYASTTDFTGTPVASLFSAAQMASFISVYNTPRDIDYSLTGLDPNKTYDFDFLVNRDISAGTTQVRIVGATQTIDSKVALQNTDLLSMAGIAPDASGQIMVYISSPTTTTLYAPINVFQFQESVPEPASLSMLALGGLTMLRRRR